jgi:peptidyl-prolyl cis-trans isomerase C
MSEPTQPQPIGRFLREPLLHFLLLGALVYGVYWVNQDPFAAPEGNRLRVTAGEIGWLTASWEKRWGRGPTAAERDGLVREYIRETVMYREALAMGLDRDDTIVRRRLAQKLEFLVQDLLQVPPPTEEQLLSYRQAHVDRYTQPAVVTFSHVFVDPDRRGDGTLDHAATLLAELQAESKQRGEPGEAAGQAGDPFLLQGYYPERDLTELSKLFGQGFATEVVSLAPRVWHGPVLSGYGVHLVYVHARNDAVELPFADVRDRVLTDWQDEERRRLNDEYFARLTERYEIIVEEPEPDALAAVPAAEVTK